jgi:Xaa-Pro aminopeptidase
MSIHQKRLEKIKNKISELGLDGIYVTNLTNVKYLTGFSGSAGQVLILPNSQHFFTDSRYQEQSKNQVKDYQISIIDGGYIKTIENNKLLNSDLKIGFESNHIVFSLFNIINKTFTSVKFEPTSEIVETVASVKDMSEIELLKSAIEITDVVFETIIKEMKVGKTEKEIAAKMSYLFKINGGDGDSFDTIVASGANSALPHAEPSEKLLENGDFVVMDFGALYQGYHADMTRTVVIGKATDKHKEIYHTVLNSQLEGIKYARAGMTGAELDKICRDYITEKGYGKEFSHSTGHGIGLEVHTSPRIFNGNNVPLEENNVVTIEPGIYIPNFGGVRVEDDVWIQKDGCVPLNRSIKELIEI